MKHVDIKRVDVGHVDIKGYMWGMWIYIYDFVCISIYDIYKIRESVLILLLYRYLISGSITGIYPDNNKR